MKTVAFVTCANFPNLTDDDRLTIPPLADRGIRVEPALWDDPGIAWEKFARIVLRSPWDYHMRIGEFFAWLEHMRLRGLQLANPYRTVMWNVKKTYLDDLADRGIRIIPTAWLSEKGAGEIKAEMKARGWEKGVVKPAVSAGAHRTFVVSVNAPSHVIEKNLHAIPDGELLILQPFLPEIQTGGEWSFIFFNGIFSHAVVKKPGAGDFRVQEKHGGTTQPADPAAGLLEQASAVLRVLDEACLYARVDGVVLEGVLHLMELELVEPSLFLSASPGAPLRFAEAIVESL